VRPRRSATVFAIGVAALAALPARAGFEDRTAAANLLTTQPTWGAVLQDVDGDGALDVLVGHHFYPPYLFWNDGGGVFSTQTHPQPWTGQIDRHGALILPLDSDGDAELFWTHGADGGAGSEQNELYRNDGAGSLRFLLGAGGMSDVEGRARSASAADFDGDGRVDIWVAEAPDVVSRNSLFRNQGNLAFTDVAGAAGLDEGVGTVGGIWGDVDDDGDLDLLAGGEEFHRPTVLWRNDGGVFADASGLFSPPLPVVAGADWGDYDNDADLDLAVAAGDIGLFDTWTEADTLTYYFNTRYTEAGLDGLTIPSDGGSAWARFRIRAFLDTSRIFLGPLGEHPSPAVAFLLTDAYVGAPAFTPGVDRGTYVWRASPGGPWEIRCSTPDLNADTFDGFLTEAQPISRVEPVDLEDPGFVPGWPRVWRNDGGSFQERTAALGLDVMLNPRDVSWADFDSDGDLDLHVVDMGTSASPNAKDALWRNDGAGKPFADVTGAQGVTGSKTGMGDGAVWGDVDGDLDLDVFLQEGAGPLTFSADGPAVLLANEGPSGNALFFDLVGTPPGTAAIGAKVTVVAGGKPVHRRVQANSWRGFQDPLRVHAGIGAAPLADSVVVQWPSGLVQTYLDVPPGVWRLVEGVPVTSARTAASPAGGWRLAGVAPQPATGDQRVLLHVTQPTRLEVVVQDLAGRRVRSLHDGIVRTGGAHLSWDGRDERGRRVAAGVYWIRATDGRREAAVRAVRLR
jgi:hypothetical protein